MENYTKYQLKSADELAQVLSGVEDGAIILMHDMKKNSITSSEMIIDRLQGDGYIFLTVEELFVAMVKEAREE